MVVMLLAAALLSPAGAARAQEPMTLKDCMAYAVANSAQLRIRRTETDDARIGRRDAILAAFTPSVSAGSSAYYNFGRSIDPQTNTYFSTTSFSNGYSVGAGFDLFDGFRAVNNIKIAQTALAIGESREKQEEAKLCLAVMEAYYNTVYYRRLHEIFREQEAVAEAALARARRQEELGQKGYADVVQTEAELCERQYDRINTGNMYRDQLMLLGDLMFWPADEELVIDCSLPAYETESVDAPALLDFALGNDPAVKIASWTADQARRELATAKWQLLPSVGVYAGWSTSYYTYRGAVTAPFGVQFRNNGGEYIQFAVNVPIFNRLQRHSNIARKRNAWERASAERDRTRRDVQTEVLRAIGDRDGADAACRQAGKKAAVQEEAWRLNLKKRDQGLISPIEFQTAENNYLKARADEMNTLFTYLIKRSVVLYYGGIDYLEQ